MFENAHNPFEWYQLFGWIAAILSITSYQLLNPRHTLSVKVFSALFFAVHYFGLSAIIAVIVCCASVLRDIATIFLSKTLLDRILIAYIAVFWIIVFVWGNSPDDYLIAVATTLATISNYYRDYFWRFRLFIFAHHILWIIAAMIMTSYPGLVVVFLNLLSNLIGMARYKMKDIKS